MLVMITVIATCLSSIFVVMFTARIPLIANDSSISLLTLYLVIFVIDMVGSFLSIVMKKGVDNFGNFTLKESVFAQERLSKAKSSFTKWQIKHAQKNPKYKARFIKQRQRNTVSRGKNTK